MAVNVGTIEAKLELDDKMSKQLNTATKKMGMFRGATKTALGTMGGFIGAQAVISGVTAVVGGAARAMSGAASSAINMNATLETSTLQFATLMGDAEKAEEHVKGLFEFAKKTPFETGPIIEASRMMQTFGGEALNTKANLQLLGDASAATGAPIDQLGFWVGRLHSQLQSGKPFGEAAMRLQELAVLSPKARDEMEKLQKAGASASEVYAAFQGDLEKFTGGMVKQAATWEGVTSTLKDVIELTLADALKPLFEFAREGVSQLNTVLSNPALEEIPNKIAEALRGAFGGDMQGAVAKFAKMVVGAFKVLLQAIRLVKPGLATVVFTFRAFAVVALSVAEVLNQVALGIAHIINMTPGLRGSMDNTISILSEWADGLDSLNDKQQEQVVESGKNIFSQNGLTRAIDGTIDVLDDMMVGFDQAAEASRNAEEATSDIAEVISREVAPAVELLTENQQKLKDGLRGAIAPARDWIAVLENVGGVAALTEAQTTTMTEQLGTAMRQMKAAGEEPDQAMFQWWVQGMDRAKNVTEQSVADMLVAFNELHAHKMFGGVEAFAPSMGIGGLGLPTLPPEPAISAGSVWATGFTKGWQTIIKDIPQTVTDAFTGGGGALGAIKAIGSQFGSELVGSLFGSFGGKDKEGEEASGGIMGMISGLAGPIGMAIGALAGPLIGGLVKLFGKPSVAESVSKTAEKMFGKSLSEGLSKAIEKTRENTASDFGAMMMHMSDIIEEMGGVAAMGMEKAIRRVRDIFSAVEQGAITTAQAAETFGESFNLLATELVESGGIASAQFVELITLAEKFGTTAETLKFVGEQSKIVAEGVAAIAASGVKSKGELEDLGLMAVASFESALAAGMSFTEAVKAHGPAIDAVIKAQEDLGLTSDNIAIQELARFQERIQANATLVTAVEALDGTMLALSRTGALNADTLAAMERQGLRMYDKLIKSGFSQHQAIMMMGPALKTIMEAHNKLGIPIDENTKKLIDQARQAGTLEDKQKSGWAAVESAVLKVVNSLDRFIDRISGIDRGLRGLPSEITTRINIIEQVKKATSKYGGGNFPGMAEGGIVTRPTAALIGEAGPEAVIPLEQLGDKELLDELRGVRTDLRNMPIMLRDAIILAQ